MTSIERTAYPRFGRLVTARELGELSPTPDEVAWARGLTRSDGHLLALVVSLKCFQRLGYFPRRERVPEVVVDHIRRHLELSPATMPEPGSERTAKLQRELVRECVGVLFDPERARQVASGAIREAAEVKNHPPDLINVALELLVKESLELPGYSTLDEMATRIRHEVNSAIFARIVGRMTETERAGVDALLHVGGPSHRSGHYRLKQAAGRASWSAFRAQVAHMAWVDSLGDAGAWLEGVAEAKIADFAGEAKAADAEIMGHVASLKATALLACMVHESRARARDDLAEMFCKRVASITKRAREELEAIRAREAEISDQLIEHYRVVLSHLDPRGPAGSDAEAARLAREAIQRAGGFDAELADIESVAAHHANNYIPLVGRQLRRDRATMFAFARTVALEATSADRSLLDALDHALGHQHFTRDLIPDHAGERVIDLSFASPRPGSAWSGPAPGASTGATSRRPCSPTSPPSCGPGTWPCGDRGPMPTGPPSWSPGRTARTWCAENLEVDSRRNAVQEMEEGVEGPLPGPPGSAPRERGPKPPQGASVKSGGP